MIAIGLAGLYFGGKWVVEGAVFMTQQLGLSEFRISATIIALGTSFPELATGIMAVRKKDIDLAIGNSVESNIFNTSWILGITLLISPVLIPAFLNIDLMILLSVTILLFLFVLSGKRRQLER